MRFTRRTEKGPLSHLLEKSYSTMKNITARLYQIAKKKSFKVKSISKEAKELAHTYWLKQSMAYTRRDLADGKLAILRPPVDDDINYATGRVQASRTSAVPRLPILTYDNPLAYQFLKHVHETDHGCPTKAVMKSKQLYWIVKARRLATKIKQQCCACRLAEEQRLEQQMVTLPHHRMEISLPFQTTALDLLGPFLI